MFIRDSIVNESKTYLVILNMLFLFGLYDKQIEFCCFGIETPDKLGHTRPDV